jgi:hypothetical protein
MNVGIKLVTIYIMVLRGIIEYTELPICKVAYTRYDVPWFQDWSMQTGIEEFTKFYQPRTILVKRERRSASHFHSISNRW